LSIEHLRVIASSLPKAYDDAIKAVWYNGISMKTQYDKENDPESKDAHVTIIVEQPLSMPRFHLNIPGGPEDLQKYTMEVIDGISDHLVDPNDPNKWKYTYHQRLFEYPSHIGEINQISTICDQLAECPFTRRAQATTWIPGYDDGIDDPPCLQRIWCRLVPVEKSEQSYNLQMHTYWRSRDLYKAWFFNAFAMIELQKKMAEEISKLIGLTVGVGEYHDTSDSLHIYGSYFKEALPRIEKMKNYNWKTRTVGKEKTKIWKEIMQGTKFKLLMEKEKMKLEKKND